MSNEVENIWQKICFCVQDLVEPRNEMFSSVKRSGVNFTNFTSEAFTSEAGQFHQTLCAKLKRIRHTVFSKNLISQLKHSISS